jgi:NADPH-dependent glutamate synthase beta subunit-like oxidoreductase
MMSSLQKDGYKAVFGCRSPEQRKLNVPREDAKGVVQALSFLKDAQLGKKVEVGKNDLVVGGAVLPWMSRCWPRD